MLFKDILYPVKPILFLYEGVRGRKVVHLSSKDYDKRLSNIFEKLATYDIINEEIKSAPIRHVLCFDNGKCKSAETYDDVVKTQSKQESILRSYQPGTHNLIELYQLEEDIKKSFQSPYAWTNLYWSKQKQALKAHRDRDSIIVLQIHGKKLWNFYGDGVNWKTEEPIHELVMEKGDFLFFPKGVLHSAQTIGEEDSLHFTIEIQTGFDRGLSA